MHRLGHKILRLCGDKVTILRGFKVKDLWPLYGRQTDLLHSNLSMLKLSSIHEAAFLILVLLARCEQKCAFWMIDMHLPDLRSVRL